MKKQPKEELVAIRKICQKMKKEHIKNTEVKGDKYGKKKN